MIIDTLGPNGEATTRIVVDKKQSGPKARKLISQMGSKNERDIIFAVGMACMAANSEPGQRHTCEEIREMTGLTKQRVLQIEERALRKCRAVFYRDKELAKEFEMFLQKH